MWTVWVRPTSPCTDISTQSALFWPLVFPLEQYLPVGPTPAQPTATATADPSAKALAANHQGVEAAQPQQQALKGAAGGAIAGPVQVRL